MRGSKKQRCECADPGCPEHKGESDCELKATTVLYRSDMDGGRVAFCTGCAADAMDSGVFGAGGAA